MSDGKTFEFRVDIQPGVPTLNGHIYGQATIDHMVKKASEGNIFVFNGPPSHTTQWSSNEICGRIREMERKEENVDAKVELFGDVSHSIPELFEAGLLEITPSGRGKRDAYGNITDYELIGFSMVRKTPNPDLNEATVIISETLNEGTPSILFKPHENGKIFAQYKTPAPDGTSGYWMTYDPENQNVYIHLTDQKVDLFDPSSVDKLIRLLEELRVP
jgi:hypothetical protein